eukprot:237472-Amorphochlora_amoeboformis.AAC.1
MVSITYVTLGDKLPLSMDAAVTATKQLRSMGFDQRSIDKYLCTYPYSFTEEKSLDYLVSRAVSWLSTQKSSQ